MVTTCHADGYERYGREMVGTYLSHWPQDVPLLFYAEGFVPDIDGPGRIVVRDLGESSPGLLAFKARHRGDPYAHGDEARLRFRPGLVFRRSQRRSPFAHVLRRHLGYRWDAVRFSHKIFAIAHAARHTDADVLIWIDADTRFFADVSLAMLEATVPADRFVGFLARQGTHSECGFVAYNLRHPGTGDLLDGLEAMYSRDLLFAEHEFHDSFLFDIVRRRVERRGHRSHDIAGGIGKQAEHVLVNSPLGAFMDHMKGDRKDTGRSGAADLVAPRPEPYWRAPG